MQSVGALVSPLEAQSDARSVDLPLPRWLFPSLFAAVILVYWIPRMFRGFWVDEAGAYWVARGGWSQVWPNLQIYPGQSILYAHLSSLFFSTGPYKEALLRLPSILGMLAAAFILYKLAEDVVGQGSGWIAAVPFACTNAIVETATNARPYAIGLAVILTSFWSLRRWLTTTQPKWLALYWASSSLIVYFHYLFGFVFVVQFVYLLAAWRNGRQVPPLRIALSWLLAGLAALPLLFQFLSIVHQAGSWKTSELPGLLTFLAFYPVQVLVAAGVGLALFLFLHRDWFSWSPAFAPDDLILLIAWLLLGPICIFAVARIGSYALFSTRYLIYALPPFFLLLAGLIRQVAPDRPRFALVAGIALSSALYVLQMPADDWRTPLAIAKALAAPNAPLLIRSGYVESAGLDWKSEPKPGSYLFAPLTAYPVPNEIIPVPFYVDAATAKYIEQEIANRSEKQHRFCLVANKEADVLDVLPIWFRAHGYRSILWEASGFDILVFDRSVP